MRMTEQQYELLQTLCERYARVIAKATSKNRDPYETTILKHTRPQHISMAQGGDGGLATGLDDATIRSEYYQNYPDVFFQTICDTFGWEYN